MNGYACPTVIGTYSIAELCADAANCTPYDILAASDRTLKLDIETVEQPLERMRSISTN
jgi:hypothetical protein